MNSGRILERALSGIRWSIVLSLLAMPLSYLTNVLLGQISPEALGAYGSIALFVSLVDSFFLLGGRQTLIRFLPELPSEKQLPFLLANLVLIAGTSLVCGTLLFLNPALVSGGLGEEFSPGLGVVLVLLVLCVILFNVCLGLLQARMEIRWTALAERMIVVVNFGGAVVLFLFSRADAFKFFLPILAGIFLTSYATPVVASVGHLKRALPPWPRSPRLYLPRGYASFVLWAEVGVASYFIQDRLDQVLVLAHFNLAQLGLYRASLVTAQLVRWLPLALSPTLLPTFVNLLAIGDHTALGRAYERLMRYGTLATSLIALTLILFAGSVLSLFGRDYASGSLTLVILSAGFIPSFMLAVSTNAALARGGIGWVTLNGLIAAGVQILLSLELVNLWGPAGAALAKVSGLVLLAGLNAAYAWRFASLAPGRGTLVLLALDASLILLGIGWTADSGFLLMRNILLLAAFAAAVLSLRIVGPAEWALLSGEVNRFQSRASAWWRVLQRA